MDLHAVHTRKKIGQESLFARAPLFSRVIALTYMELLLRSKICVSKLQFFVAKACQNSNLLVLQLRKDVPIWHLRLHG